MPAVQLERLKTEMSSLVWQFTNPVEFHRRLSDLLDGYSNRGYRAGLEVKTIKFIQVYHVSPLVINQLEKELSRLGRENPGAGCLLADELWIDEHLETRQLAAFLLGQIPLTSLDEVLQRLVAWSKPEEEMASLGTLLQKGSYLLRRQMPDRWLEVIGGWLQREEVPYQKMGLQALIPILEDREFENTPPVFRMIQPLFIKASPLLFSSLQDVVTALDRQIPGETTYFVRQVIYLNPKPEVMRMMRRMLPQLSEDTQANLKSVIKEFS